METTRKRLRARLKPGPKVFKEGKKRCNCQLHQGDFVPLDKFWFNKTGPRAGKPMSRCKDGIRLEKGIDPGKSGYVRYEDVKFIFFELEARIGKAETCRRMGISQNFWMRMERRIQTHTQKATVAKAIEVLREARANNEVRHRDSIRHGAAARGKKEREVKSQRDLNKPQGDNDNERKRNYYHKHPDYAKRQTENRIKTYREKHGLLPPQTT